MRYVDRGEPPAALSEALARRQTGVAPDTPASREWERFGSTPEFRELGRVLRERFRDKCAYCEAARALTIDHFWPKSPAPANGHRGTPLRLYAWDNLLPACRDCQSFECKGAKLFLDPEDRPLFLDPSRAEDDPIRYVEIVIPASDRRERRRPLLPDGWMDPRAGLGGGQADRARITIHELKLNEGRRGADLWEERARTLLGFLDLLHFYHKLGPDAVGPNGRTLRQRLLDLLDDRSPYLAGIRQLLWAQPSSAALRAELIGAMPELAPRIAALAPAFPDPAAPSPTEVDPNP